MKKTTGILLFLSMFSFTNKIHSECFSTGNIVSFVKEHPFFSVCICLKSFLCFYVLKNFVTTKKINEKIKQDQKESSAEKSKSIVANAQQSLSSSLWIRSSDGYLFLLNIEDLPHCPIKISLSQGKMFFSTYTPENPFELDLLRSEIDSLICYQSMYKTIGFKQLMRENKISISFIKKYGLIDFYNSKIIDQIETLDSACQCTALMEPIFNCIKNKAAVCKDLMAFEICKKQEIENKMSKSETAFYWLYRNSPTVYYSLGNCLSLFMEYRNKFAGYKSIKTSERQYWSYNQTYLIKIICYFDRFAPIEPRDGKIWWNLAIYDKNDNLIKLYEKISDQVPILFDNHNSMLWYECVEKEQYWHLYDIEKNEDIILPVSFSTSLFATSGVIAVSMDGNLIAAQNKDKGIIYLLNIKDRNNILYKELNHPNASAIAFSPDSTKLVSGSENTIELWNLNDIDWNNAETIRPVTLTTDIACYDIEFHSDNQHIIIDDHLGRFHHQTVILDTLNLKNPRRLVDFYNKDSSGQENVYESILDELHKSKKFFAYIDHNSDEFCLYDRLGFEWYRKKTEKKGHLLVSKNSQFACFGDSSSFVLLQQKDGKFEEVSTNFAQDTLCVQINDDGSICLRERNLINFYERLSCDRDQYQCYLSIDCSQYNPHFDVKMKEDKPQIECHHYAKYDTLTGGYKDETSKIIENSKQVIWSFPSLEKLNCVREAIQRLTLPEYLLIQKAYTHCFISSFPLELEKGSWERRCYERSTAEVKNNLLTNICSIST